MRFGCTGDHRIIEYWVWEVSIFERRKTGQECYVIMPRSHLMAGPRLSLLVNVPLFLSEGPTRRAASEVSHWYQLHPLPSVLPFPSNTSLTSPYISLDYLESLGEFFFFFFNSSPFQQEVRWSASFTVLMSSAFQDTCFTPNRTTLCLDSNIGERANP